VQHEFVIVGAGSAGISVAARLRRAGEDDIAVIDPAGIHYYQPLWTLVGGGLAEARESARKQADVMPRGVRWIQDRVTHIDADDRAVELASGLRVSYRYLVVCPGIQLDWDRVEGLEATLGANGVSSNYRYDLAPRTWEHLRTQRGGRAVFTMPSGPIKCAGAPQKIAYLAADHFQRQGIDATVTLVLPTPGIFGIPVFARELERVIERYGMDVRFDSEVVAIDGPGKRVTIVDRSGDEASTAELDFETAHVVPPQSAPDWLKATSLSDGTPNGYVDIDAHTMQHVRYPEVFALGDAGNSPNSKTGAAIRKQAPVVTENLLAVAAGGVPTARYSGYASCPITTAHNRMLLAEFDYTMEPAPSIPGIDTTKERYDMWLLKRYGLPALYWNLMLRGLA
jgi:sulfide:quinone oxidoreductase